MQVWSFSVQLCLNLAANGNLATVAVYPCSDHDEPICIYIWPYQVITNKRNLSVISHDWSKTLWKDINQSPVQTRATACLVIYCNKSKHVHYICGLLLGKPREKLTNLIYNMTVIRPGNTSDDGA